MKRKTCGTDLPLGDEKEQELNRVRTEEAKLQTERRRHEMLPRRKTACGGGTDEAERVAAERAERNGLRLRKRRLTDRG